MIKPTSALGSILVFDTAGAFPKTCGFRLRFISYLSSIMTRSLGVGVCLSWHVAFGHVHIPYHVPPAHAHHGRVMATCSCNHSGFPGCRFDFLWPQTLLCCFSFRLMVRRRLPGILLHYRQLLRGRFLPLFLPCLWLGFVTTFCCSFLPSP